MQTRGRCAPIPLAMSCLAAVMSTLLALQKWLGI